MPRFYLFPTEAIAKERHAALTRLGWHPHSIFRHRDGWAFWVA